MSSPSFRWPSLDGYPFTSGRPASARDVDAGGAVFVLAADEQAIGVPIAVDLPQYAFHVNVKTGQRTPCVVIQAEEARGQRLIGCRSVYDGSSMVGFFGEFELMGKVPPDDE